MSSPAETPIPGREARSAAVEGREARSAAVEGREARSAAVLNLQGEVCPYTFLRTKLALEELPPGAELTLLLDHPPAFRSVPRSLEEDGHQVLAIDISSDGQRCTVHARKALQPNP